MWLDTAPFAWGEDTRNPPPTSSGTFALTDADGVLNPLVKTGTHLPADRVDLYRGQGDGKGSFLDATDAALGSARRLATSAFLIMDLDAEPDGAALVGNLYTLADYSNSVVIDSLQAVFRGAPGTSFGAVPGEARGERPRHGFAARCALRAPQPGIW